ncbi:MAG: LemA family protein [Acidimicrobiia bacterium]|nr:LemA family protein [Acidimicrobiia bacterium]
MVLILAVVAVLVVVALVVLVVLYNGLQRDRQLVREAWAQIDVMLARRHRLVTDLAAVAAAAAAYERKATEEVIAARAAAESADGPARRGEAEVALDRGVAQVFAVAEAYPDLQADATFARLQRELVQSEDDVSAARRYYNGRVRRYQDRRATFPSSVLAGPLSFGPAEYFQVERDAREAPHVT